MDHQGIGHILCIKGTHELQNTLFIHRFHQQRISFGRDGFLQAHYYFEDMWIVESRILGDVCNKYNLLCLLGGKDSGPRVWDIPHFIGNAPYSLCSGRRNRGFIIKGFGNSGNGYSCFFRHILYTDTHISSLSITKP